MANPIFSQAPDRSVATALQAALQAPRDHGRIHYNQIVHIIRAAHDGRKISDVEFRDLKKILRTQPLWGAARRMLEGFLQLYYPLKALPPYRRNVLRFEDRPPIGSHQCAALVQHTMPVGLTSTWREGIRVRGNGHFIKPGTAIATFEDGFYPNRNYGNHVAYYISQTDKGIRVMDQWLGKKRISSRTLAFRGKRADGTYPDPSNNGDAFSVIMHKA